MKYKVLVIKSGETLPPEFVYSMWGPTPEEAAAILYRTYPRNLLKNAMYLSKGGALCHGVSSKPYLALWVPDHNPEPEFNEYGEIGL